MKVRNIKTNKEFYITAHQWKIRYSKDACYVKVDGTDFIWAPENRKSHCGWIVKNTVAEFGR